MPPSDSHSSLLEIPRHKRRIFKKHFLSSVHCEIGISGVQSDSIRANRDLIAKGLAPLGFDHAGDFQQSNITLGGAAQGAPQVLQGNSPAGVTFWSENPKRQLYVTPNGLVLSDFAYEGFEDFSRRLATAARLISKILNVNAVSKLGLRKISSVRIDAAHRLADAVSGFNPYLFATVRSGVLMSNALKAAQEVIFLERDGSSCVLRTAITSTGVPDGFDAHLDLDLIDQRARELEEALDVKIHEMNAFHFDIFMWAVTPDFLSKMEG